MATIFEKLPASGEKCLILEPREALVYPFQLGDWTQLRMSAAISFTATNNNNSIIASETIASSNSPYGSMYWGLYSGNGSLPFSEDSSFVGFGNRTGTSLILGNANDNNAPTYPAITINTIGRPNLFFNRPLMSGFSSVGRSFLVFSGHGQDVAADGLGFTNSKYFALPSSGTATNTPPYLIISGEQNYCVIQSMLFNVVNKSQFGQSFDLCWANNGASGRTNVSIDILKQCNSNLQFSSRFTGLYYNSNCSSTGSPIDLPTNILIYFPFLNNRTRIHSLLIEKY